MENKHKQQLARHSKRIIKCEEDHTRIREAVYQLGEEIADVKEKYATMITDIDGRMGEIRNEMVDGDQLRDTIMNQFNGRLDQFDNTALRLDDCIGQVYAYVDQKNTEMHTKITRIDHNTDYELDTMKKNNEEELHKIRENYKHLSSKVKGVKQSCTESQEEVASKIQQQLTYTETMIATVQQDMVENMERKLKELQHMIVDGDLMDKSTLNQTYQASFANVDGRLKLMELRQRTLGEQLGVIPTRNREQLEQGLKQLEQNLSKRDADVANEGRRNLEALRAEINSELMIAKSHLEALNTSLHVTGTKLHMIETIQNRAPIGFTARATGYQISTRYPIMKGFTEVTCNDGGYYNTLSGVFTAPISGVYVVNLTHTQSDDGEIFLNVVQGHRSSDLKTLVAYTWTYGKHSTSSDSSVVKLQLGDVLYVKVQHYSGNGQIWSPSSFSCFLLREQPLKDGFSL